VSGVRRAQGFTLIELLVSVAILGIVTSQMFMVFSSEKRVFEANQRLLDVQEDARLVIDLIAFDARQAGFMVPRIAGVASADGGANGPDRLCVSDVSYFEYPLPGSGTSVFDPRDEHFDTARVTTFTDNVTLVLASLDIDGSGAPAAVDFQPGAGVIVSNGELSACAQVSAVNTVTNTLTLAAGHALDANAFVTHASGVGGVRVTPAVVYELSGTNLLRNGLLIAPSVEDLQIEYWVDNAGVLGASPAPGNGQVDTDEFPVHDLNNPPTALTVDTSRIRRVRVSVLTVTNRQESRGGGEEWVTAGRPAVANRVAGGPDSFQRRKFTASVMPKNLL
jgi:prepilin-type N-terminal cleavage/methylation domain-containing protein